MAVYYTITETRTGPLESEVHFFVKKHRSDLAAEQLGQFSTLGAAEGAIKRAIYYPQVMEPVRYDDKGNRIGHITLAPPPTNVVSFTNGDTVV